MGISMTLSSQKGWDIGWPTLGQIVELGFMTSVETQLERIPVAEADGAATEATDFPINALHFPAGETSLVVCKDDFGLA
jgi:hypothetical protein